MPVRNNVTLHPATVTRAELLATEIRRAKRKKPVRGPSVTTYRVPAEVLAIAVMIAGGDRGRIELCEDGSAVVHNSRNWRR